MGKKIIILGGGIAGLSAGVYAQLLGYESEIFEQHTIAGGLCTGWSRENHHIDGCIHWLTGSKANTELNDVWKNLGAINDDTKFFQFDNFGEFSTTSGSLVIWKDLNLLRHELLELSKEDEKQIDALINDIKSVQSMLMPAYKPMDLMTFFEKIKTIKKMSPSFKVISNKNMQSCEEYGLNFKHPTIQHWFKECMPPHYAISSYIFTLASFCLDNAGVPEGGSLGMAQRIKKRYETLGGKIHLNSKIEEILIDKGMCRGVITNSTTHTADHYISTIDPHVLFSDLLKHQISDSKLTERYDNPTDYPLNTSILVSFSVDFKLDNKIINHNKKVDPFTVMNNTYDAISYRSYGFEENFAPQGKSTIQSTLMLNSKDYDAWNNLDDIEYQMNKRKARSILKDVLESNFPELKNHISIIDIAIPKTFNTFTNAYKGSWMAFTNTPNSKLMDHKGFIKGVDNLYFAGQWTRPPGGLPIAATSGKFIVQRIAKKDKRNFVIK